MTLPRLPTPMFKEVEGFSLECNAFQLNVTAPEWMVPVRHYCQVVIARCNQSKSFIIDIIHEEPYVQAAPGRNAWQTALHNSLKYTAGFSVNPQYVTHTDIKSRRLERKWDRIKGVDHEVRALKAGMMRGEWPGTRKARTLVRVTPQGFRIQMFEANTSSDQMKGIGRRVTPATRRLSR